MMYCENCINVVLGDYDRSVKDLVKAVYNDNAKIMPCCKAEICKKCYAEMLKNGRCEMCGKILRGENR